MGRPRKQDIAEATTERILDAAQSYFADAGFDATRLQDIAKKAGITRPSLLYHFESKEVLYTAVVERSFAELLEAFGRLEIGGTTPVEIADAVVVAYLRFLEIRPHLSGIVLRELLSSDGRARDIVIEKLVPVLDWVETILTEMAAGTLPPGFPVRAAIMQIAANAMLQSAAGDFKTKLWGKECRSRELTRVLFSPSASTP